jgi:hypothetical protein
MTFLPCVFGLLAFVPASVGLGGILAWLCELGGDGLHPLIQTPSKTPAAAQNCFLLAGDRPIRLIAFILFSFYFHILLIIALVSV